MMRIDGPTHRKGLHFENFEIFLHIYGGKYLHILRNSITSVKGAGISWLLVDSGSAGEGISIDIGYPSNILGNVS
jgi:hypothetical protein